MRARATWLVAVPLLAACGVPAEDAPRFRADAEVPFGLLERTTSTTSTTVGGDVGGPPACLADEDTVRVVARGAASLLERLRASPSETEQEAGLRSALPDPGVVVAATVRAGVAEVALGEGFLDLVGRAQRLAIAQLVCTATATPGVGQVRFTLGDAPLPVPRGDGTLTDEVVALDDYVALLDR